MIDRKFRLPRIWSNEVIRQVGGLFEGDIINVSGWKDEDKQGGVYKDYFPHKRSYAISNFGGFRGFQAGAGEIFLNLEEDLASELERRFDVVFNHTTLEHVFEVRKAFANLCKMSRDILIVVVPFSQTQHETNDFKDFWRFTPTCLRYLCAENDFGVIYESANSNLHAATYVVVVASRSPQKWIGRMPDHQPMSEAAWLLGASPLAMLKRVLLRRR